jgi:hypothetical protein
MKRSLIAFVIAVFVVSLAAEAQGPHRRSSRANGAAATPCAHDINDCVDEGCGGRHDPELNKQKNIRSDEQQPVLESIAWMKALPDPTDFTADNRNRDELRQIGEGKKIMVVAWAMVARKGGKETCNCKLSAPKDTDNHIVLVDPAVENPTLVADEDDSETAEFTPRVRLDHPKFTRENLEPLIDPDWKVHKKSEGKLLVRVTGLLLFDSEHFLNNPLHRHNNWEIHPVLKLEYCPEGETCRPDSDENWKDLESE